MALVHILSLVVTEICVTMYVLRAFTIARPLNARLYLAGFNSKNMYGVPGVLHGAEESHTRW